MLSIKGLRKELHKNKRKVVAVSPFIGTKAFSGPAVKYMTAAGIETTAYGVAQMYADVASKIVIDTKDKSMKDKIEGLDIKVYDTKIGMKNKQSEDALASFILKQVRT